VQSEADGHTKYAGAERLAVRTEDFACLLEKARDLHGQHDANSRHCLVRRPPRLQGV
jgi:hypothetical protein